MNGEYTEKLPSSSGKIVVTKNSWHINFYFSGPDLRYNGTIFNIASGSIDSYIEAYREAWSIYITTKEKMIIRENGELKLKGKMNLNINIGGYLDGICLASGYLRFSSERSIEQFINSLIWAKQRAEEVKELLNSL